MTAIKQKKKRAPQNRTLELSQREAAAYKKNLVYFEPEQDFTKTRNKIICGDAFGVLKTLPNKRFDLLFVDPPYNLNKNFGKNSFKQTSLEEYENWLESWVSETVRILKPNASIYICGDWRSASAIQRVGMKYFKLRNRITWEREKGRGAKTNWKNSLEDIWFFTVSDDYFFDVEAVKMKRRVIAPYKENGKPKDWKEEKSGNYRLTSPSNLWNDLTVPFWSMPENTDHPTQKPEKLLAKIILASTKKGDLILDPFLGSGTTAVVAKKLRRDFIGIEEDEQYYLLPKNALNWLRATKPFKGLQTAFFGKEILRKKVKEYERFKIFGRKFHLTNSPRQRTVLI